MRLHPLHPMSVHFPIACLVFTPLADAAAWALNMDALWLVGAIASAGAVVFGVVAAMLGALDFAAAREKAPRIVLLHASLMSGALMLGFASSFGRFGANFAPLMPPPAWAIGAGAAAAVLMLLGAWFGGELVYGRGVNVRTAPDKI